MSEEFYIFVENLPRHTTKQEVYDLFSEKIGPPSDVWIFSFKMKLIYDFQSGIIHFKAENSEKKIESIKKMDFFLGGHKLIISFRYKIDDFLSTVILYDIDKTSFNSFISPELCNYDMQYLCPIKSTNLRIATGYIIRFHSIGDSENFIKALPDYHIKPIIQKNKRTFSFPNNAFKQIPKMDNLYDFFLIHRGKKYGVFRCCASKLSVVIAKCNSNELLMPDIEGPIEVIVNYLNLQEIVITPEIERFLFVMASFLKITEIISKTSDKNQESMNIMTALLFTHSVFPDSLQFHDLCKFLSSNIEDLICVREFQEIPSYFIGKIVELSAPQLESHDALIKLIIDANIEAQSKQEMLKFVDPKKVSPSTLSIFFSSSKIDLNKIRDFVASVLFD